MSLLSVPLNVDLLTALGDEELALADLSRTVGHPPATTLRSYLKALVDLGALERRQETNFPGTVVYSLTRSGERLLLVGSALQNWLREAPDGEPIALGGPAAKSAIKALVEGWNASIIRVLAAKPLALTELAKLITGISYPTLERRLAALRRTGQLQARRSGGSRGTPYEVTDWARRAAGPLIAAVGWEREWAPSQTKALSRIDIEAFFLLAIPLLNLPDEFSGRCRLAVEMRAGPQAEYAGTTVMMDAGRPVSWTARLEGDPDAWAGGSASRWLEWLASPADHLLELGGDSSLARAVLETLREDLFLASRVETA